MLRWDHPFTKGAVGLLALVVLNGPAELPAAAPDGEPEAVLAECELTLRPAEVPQGPEAPVVRATLSEEIGEIRGVSVQERSQVQVEEVEAPSPNVLVITLRTEEAEAGQWTVTVEGENGQCTGRLTVQGGTGYGLD